MGTLYDREAELSALADALAHALRGNGRLIVVEGVPGIGKTTLLDEIAGRARTAEATVLRARAGQFEVELAYGVVRQLFEPALARADESRRSGLLAGSARTAASALGLQAGGIVVDVFAALHGLFWLTANLASERPLVLVIDDVQWADPPSLRFLLYLARRFEDLPVLVLVATRPPGSGPGSELVAGLVADASAIRLEPALLGAPSVLSFIREHYETYADPRFAEACARSTGGNPFLLAELVRACRREAVPATAAGAERLKDLGPKTVARAVLLRITALGSDARALARAVAILGANVPLSRAAALAELSAEAASAAADALAEAAVLDPGRPLEFLHPVIRNAVYGDLTAADRSTGHKKAAELLAAERADVDAVAAHVAAAEPAGDPRAVDALLAAARSAVARGAADGALRLLRRALEEPPPAERRDEVLVELGRAGTIAGAHAEAVEHLLPVLERLSDARARADLAMLIVPAMAYGGRAPEADALCDRLVAELEPIDRELALTLDAHERFSRTDAEQAERLRRYRDLPGSTSGERLVLSRTAHVLALLGDADVEETLDIARRALPSPADINIGSPLEGTCTFETLWALLVCDRPDPTHALGDAMAEQMRAHGYEYPFVFQLSWAAELAYREGRIADVHDAAERALAIAGRYPFGVVPGHRALGFLVLSHLERGDVAGARAAWDAIDVGPNFMGAYGELRHFEAELELAEGDLEAGIAMLSAFGEACEEHGRLNPSYWPWRARLAVALVRAGRRDEAAALVDEGLARARRFGAPAPIAILLGAQAAIEGDGPGIGLLREAVSLLEGSPARLEHARAAVDLGAALRRRRARIESREHLRLGLDLALRCGADALAGRAREELAASGARLRREHVTGVEALTPSERRIAELAARGVTNREIAQTLFLSVRTIEMHLGSAYRKLGVASRGELPAVLGVRVTGAVDPSGAAPDGTVSILVCDIEGPGAMPERLGDRRWLDLLRSHDDAMRREIARTGGFELQKAGDAFTVAFPSVRKALDCAAGMQRAAGRRAEEGGERLPIRIGLHVGEATAQADGRHGGAAAVAAGIARHASGGEILASSLIKALAGGVDGVEFAPGRQVTLTEVPDPETVHPVVW